MPLHDAEALTAAEALARSAHAGQTDKLGVPYIAHVAHVAGQLRRFGNEYEIVGWLHDIVEDCDVSLDEIDARFGPIVRRGVDAMTRRRGEDYFADYLPRVIANQCALRAKYADSRHNLAKVHLLEDAKTRERLGAKYQHVLRRLEQAQFQLSRWGDLGPLSYRDGEWRSAPGAS